MTGLMNGMHKRYLHLNAIIEVFSSKRSQAGVMIFIALERLGSGIIVGRINLVDIDPVNGTAHVGNRIGEAFTQKGIANEALKLLVKLAPDLNVTQIQAKTTSDNIASQKVLMKNGFERISINEEISTDSGQKLIFFHYSRNL
ncbi:MAG: GNAT family N-acetyltransferase [Bacillota bacterium]